MLRGRRWCAFPRERWFYVNMLLAGCKFRMDMRKSRHEHPEWRPLEVPAHASLAFSE